MAVQVEDPVAVVHRRIDLRLFPHNCYWTGVLYFTGGAELNVRMRQAALDQSMTLSEYAVCDAAGAPLPVTCEEDVFRHLGMPFLQPCERSN
jgi:DNA polymerase/3'-5' exonuclease PolX